MRSTTPAITPAYAHVSGKEVPIYVGKTEPQRAEAKDAQEQGPKLYERLAKDHLKSIRTAQEYAATASLKPIRAEDFSCRWLPLPSANAAAVEQTLINTYQPPWNIVCDGFGKHGDASSTRKNTRSEWDTIHPGRKWALTPETVPNQKSPAEIQALILKHTAPKE